MSNYWTTDFVCMRCRFTHDEDGIVDRMKSSQAGPDSMLARLREQGLPGGCLRVSSCLALIA